MRWLEVRRHAMTKKGAARGRGSHLSADGVLLARLSGGRIGPIDYVVTSAAPRAVETALAMGYAVDDTVDMPSGYVPGEVAHHDQWSWPRPFVTYAGLVRKGGLAAVARVHHDIWIRAVESAPEGGSALVISHGGGIEPALVHCLPEADHAAWGSPFGHCEGARLTYRDGRFINAQLYRVDR